MHTEAEAEIVLSKEPSFENIKDFHPDYEGLVFSYKGPEFVYSNDVFGLQFYFSRDFYKYRTVEAHNMKNFYELAEELMDILYKDYEKNINLTNYYITKNNDGDIISIREGEYDKENNRVVIWELDVGASTIELQKAFNINSNEFDKSLLEELDELDIL